MNKRVHRHISLAGIVLALTIGAAAFYFSGCVVIPQSVAVVSGTSDRIDGRLISGCESIEGTSSVPSSAARLDPDGFSILSWNSHKGTHADWLSDLAGLSRQTDFVLLQEAVLDSGLRKGMKDQARDWLLATAFESAGREVGIFSAGRVAPRSYCALREAEPLLVIPKMILVATYPIAGNDADLLVVNIHVINFTLDNQAVSRQLAQVAGIIDKHQGPVIVAGDFNTWSEGRQSLVGLKMRELGLESVAFIPDNRTTFFSRVVDEVYYRGLEVTQALSHVVQSSDHNPLEVHFRLAPPARG